MTNSRKLRLSCVVLRTECLPAARHSHVFWGLQFLRQVEVHRFNLISQLLKLTATTSIYLSVMFSVASGNDEGRKLHLAKDEQRLTSLFLQNHCPPPPLTALQHPVALCKYKKLGWCIYFRILQLVYFSTRKHLNSSKYLRYFTICVMTSDKETGEAVALGICKEASRI